MTSLSSTLQRSEGYCDLGMWREALAELDSVPIALRSQPEVLWRELKVHVGRREWLRAATLGIRLCTSWPERTGFILETAFILEQAGEVGRAISLLSSAPGHIWKHAEAWYSLACLRARTADLDASRDALGRCFEIDQTWRFTAMYEPALANL